MATGYASSTKVVTMADLYARGTGDLIVAIRAANDANWTGVTKDAGEAVKEAAAPKEPIEWTKYPPPRDPFAGRGPTP